MTSEKFTGWNFHIALQNRQITKKRWFLVLKNINWIVRYVKHISTSVSSFIKFEENKLTSMLKQMTNVNTLVSFMMNLKLPFVSSSSKSWIKRFLQSQSSLEEIGSKKIENNTCSNFAMWYIELNDKLSGKLEVIKKTKINQHSSIASIFFGNNTAFYFAAMGK